MLLQRTEKMLEVLHRHATASARARHAGEVDIVILDVSMPRQSGAQTFEALRALSPTVRVLLSSGYHGDHLEPALRAAVDGFLPKPYSLQQLIDALKSVG